MAVKYTCLAQTTSEKVTKLLKVYDENPYFARVMYFNDGTDYTTERLAYFEYENGDFEVAVFTKKYGISKTNRKYSRETKGSCIFYKKKKFYQKNQKGLSQLTYDGLTTFLNIHLGSKYQLEKELFLKGLMEKFTWMRFIAEHPETHSIAFNSLIKYKLYSLNDVLRHLYKSPIKVAKMVVSYLNIHGNHIGNDKSKAKSWKIMLPYLTNVENIKPEMIQNHIFRDAVHMAKVLDKKINCSWNMKRLVSEHDKWSKEITLTILKSEPLLDLTLSKIYRDFAKFSGYRVLKTNKEMMYEGMVQNHCVATYISKANQGRCAIYHVDGYTLELCYGNRLIDNNLKQTLYIQQFRGLRNISAPQELVNKVNEQLSEFLVAYKDTETFEETIASKQPEMELEDFPW